MPDTPKEEGKKEQPLWIQKMLETRRLNRLAKAANEKRDKRKANGAKEGGFSIPLDAVPPRQQVATTGHKTYNTQARRNRFVMEFNGKRITIEDM